VFCRDCNALQIQFRTLGYAAATHQYLIFQYTSLRSSARLFSGLFCMLGSMHISVCVCVCVSACACGQSFMWNREQAVFSSGPLRKILLFLQNTARIHTEFISSTIYTDTPRDALAGKIYGSMKYGPVHIQKVLKAILWWDGDWAKVTPQ